MITPDVVLIYAHDDENNSKRDSDSEYGPEDDDDDVLVEKNFDSVLIFTAPHRKQRFCLL